MHRKENVLRIRKYSNCVQFDETNVFDDGIVFIFAMVSPSTSILDSTLLRSTISLSSSLISSLASILLSFNDKVRHSFIRFELILIFLSFFTNYWVEHSASPSFPFPVPSQASVVSEPKPWESASQIKFAVVVFSILMNFPLQVKSRWLKVKNEYSFSRTQCPKPQNYLRLNHCAVLSSKSIL